MMMGLSPCFPDPTTAGWQTATLDTHTRSMAIGERLYTLKNQQIPRAIMHPYRSHNCGELRDTNAGETVRLSGWVHRKRDHGNLLFVDLRDPFGITQCVIDTSSPIFETVEGARVESVLTVSGPVVTRSDETVNEAIPTGRVEVQITEVKVESPADVLPLQVNSDEDSGEDIRLRYR